MTDEMRISDGSSDVCSCDLQDLLLTCDVEQEADPVILLIFGHQLTDAVQRAFERPGVGRMIGHQLRQPVDLPIAHLEDTAGVLEDRARLQLSEGDNLRDRVAAVFRSEEHTSELQSLMRISYAVLCLKKNKNNN